MGAHQEAGMPIAKKKDKRAAALKCFRSTVKSLRTMTELPPYMTTKLIEQSEVWQQQLQDNLQELYAQKVNNEIARKEEDAFYDARDEKLNQREQRKEDKLREADGLVLDTINHSYWKRMKMTLEEKDLGAQAFKDSDFRAAAQHWTCATNHLLFFDLKT